MLLLLLLWAQELLSIVKRLTILLPESHATPKLNLMAHAVMLATSFGNPMLGHTCKDESLNRKLKLVCRHCHSNNLDKIVILKIAEQRLKIIK